MLKSFIVLATLVSLSLAAPSAQEKRNQFFCDATGTSCTHVCACSDSTTQEYNVAGTTAACLQDQNKGNIETIYHSNGETQICKTSVPDQFESHCSSYGEGATCAPIDKQQQYFPNKRDLEGIEEKREELVKRKSHFDCYCTDGRGGVADGATSTLCSLYTSGGSYTNGYGSQSCPDYRYGDIDDAVNWWLKECGGFSVQNGATCVPEK